MAKSRLRKYKKNRRIYDAREKCYVTAEELRLRLVVMGEQVEDHETGMDVTGEVLISVIRNDFKRGRVTATILRSLIRSYIT